MNAIESLKFFVPEFFLLSGAFVALVLDLFTKSKKLVGILSLLTLLGTAWLTTAPEGSYALFYGFFTLDSFTHFFRLLALAITGITILVSMAYKTLPRQHEGEYYSLFLFMAFALTLAAGSTNLVMIFMSIEFISILSYLFTGFLKKNSNSKEAAVKYLLFGSFASGVMLYGMSLLFGASGGLEISQLQASLSAPGFHTVAIVGLLFFFVGLGFKISMAPFHMWAPDVYQAAPTPVTGFLTVAPKAIGFAVLMRVLFTGFPWLSGHWQHALMILSILTMTIGNVIAISQVNIKRLLAYSSIAQAGYILMGLVAANQTGQTAVLVYLVAYALTNLGAFTAVIMASNHLDDDDIHAYAGLAKKSPLLAASLTLFFLSLAGIPPLAGFIGKFYVFAAIIQQNFIGLAIAAAINSAIAAFYYFKVVRLMYLTAPLNENKLFHAPSHLVALSLLLVGTLVMGLFPAPFIQFVQNLLIFA